MLADLTLSLRYIHKYPFVRLVIPWIAGVFFGDYFFEPQADYSLHFLVFVLSGCLSFLFYYLKSYSLRWCFGVSLTGFCVMGGWLSVISQLEKVSHDFPKEESAYRVVLTDYPDEKENTYLCKAFLKERLDTVESHGMNQQVILYVAKDSLAARLQCGDELLVSANIAPPVNQGNFDEFDYERYLLRKGIGGTGYVAMDKWKLLRTGCYTSFQTKATVYRKNVIALYRELGFEGEELAVLSALTIGDQAELSESVLESYAVSGASHILALSGSHIAMLSVLLFFVIRLPAQWGKYGVCLRGGIILLLLWSFAFFTGFSPSVIRSVCMFSMLTLAGIINRKSVTINLLASTAFLMLLCNPVWLFDVGFQLSFLAVAAILLIQPPIHRLITVKSKIGKYVWSVMSVSIAAQLGTAPLVLLYFSRFSTHFLLTNLIVIPLVSLILYVAILVLIFTPITLIQSGLVWILKKMLFMLNAFVRWVEQLPYASIDNIWLYKGEVCLIYLFIMLLFLSFAFRKRMYYNRLIQASLFCLLALCTVHVAMYWNDRPQRSLVFYNVRKCPVVHSIAADGKSWLVYADSSGNRKPLYRTASNYWKHHHLLPPIELTSDYGDRDIQVLNQILTFGKSRVCMISDNRWENKITAAPLSIDYLYLCKGCNGSMKELIKLFTPSCVVLDASLSEYRKKNLSAECHLLGIRLVSLSEEGSVRFLL